MTPGAPTSAEQLVPDRGASVAEVLAGATHVAVVAHPDDLELVTAPVLLGTLDGSDRVVGIVATDGGGSPTVAGGPTAGALVAARVDEQAAAADLGGYDVVLLGRTSDEVRTDPRALAARLRDLLADARPNLVATHDPLDRHATHRAVAAATVEALRSGPPVPSVLGCEGWRGLDWLADADRVAVDVSPVAELVGRLARCFATQLAAKGYDEAVLGRWRAHATFDDPRAPDLVTHLAWAVDLTPASRADGPTLAEHCRAIAARAVAGLDLP